MVHRVSAAPPPAGACTARLLVQPPKAGRVVLASGSVPGRALDLGLYFWRGVLGAGAGAFFGGYLCGGIMDHKQKLKPFVSDYKALGEAAALADLDLACQAALHHMRKGDEMAMLRQSSYHVSALLQKGTTGRAFRNRTLLHRIEFENALDRHALDFMDLEVTFDEDGHVARAIITGYLCLQSRDLSSRDPLGNHLTVAFHSPAKQMIAAGKPILTPVLDLK